MRVGGLKEKVMAAGRVGIGEVIVPKQNAKNGNEDLTAELREGRTIHLVSTIDEVLALALVPTSTDKREEIKGKKEEAKSEVRTGRGVPPPPA